MSDTYERRKTRQGRAEHFPRPEDKPDDEQQAEPTTFDEAESIRSGSQTAQDRDHTIRGGDDHTGPMKEFPT
jgi:hypothetical protein